LEQITSSHLVSVAIILFVKGCSFYFYHGNIRNVKHEQRF